MKQLDFIKIKRENVQYLDKQHLVEHPTIKGRYNLIAPKNGFKGKTLFGKNLDVYYNEESGTLALSCSIPYFLYGHNYCDLSGGEVLELFQYLSSLLKVDLSSANVLEFEMALIHNSTKPASEIISNIISVKGMGLKKKERHFAIYSNNQNNLAFKVYDVKKNLRVKTSKVVFDTIVFEGDHIVKTELKTTKCKNFPLDRLISNYTHIPDLKVLSFLKSEVVYLSTSLESVGEKFDDILLYTLLKLGVMTHANIPEMVLQTIDKMDVSHSKKSARRNSLNRKLLALCQGMSTQSLLDDLYYYNLTQADSASILTISQDEEDIPF